MSVSATSASPASPPLSPLPGAAFEPIDGTNPLPPIDSIEEQPAGSSRLEKPEELKPSQIAQLFENGEVSNAEGTDIYKTLGHKASQSAQVTAVLDRVSRDNQHSVSPGVGDGACSVTSATSAEGQPSPVVSDSESEDVLDMPSLIPSELLDVAPLDTDAEVVMSTEAPQASSTAQDQPSRIQRVFTQIGNGFNSLFNGVSSLFSGAGKVLKFISTPFVGLVNLVRAKKETLPLEVEMQEAGEVEKLNTWFSSQSEEDQKNTKILIGKEKYESFSIFKKVVEFVRHPLSGDKYYANLGSTLIEQNPLLLSKYCPSEDE